MTQPHSITPITLGLICVALLGCTSSASKTGTEASHQPLWQAFSALSMHLEKNPSFTDYKSYLADELVEIVAAQPAASQPEMIQQLALPNWFGAITGHAEGSIGERNCLTVDGVSVNGDPISAAAEYVPESGQLKIRAVEIEFLQTRAGEAEVWCPIRPDEF